MIEQLRQQMFDISARRDALNTEIARRTRALESMQQEATLLAEHAVSLAEQYENLTGEKKNTRPTYQSAQQPTV